ncbi:VOC family protein [Micrococcoides hystricis]|uniref:VOC family protein n=1 Tax=Micrococcoides hystricis TaxID=1572761 RepID=A0ABV6P9A9_9MICC
MDGRTEIRALAPQRIIPNIWCNGNAEEVGVGIADVFTRAAIPATTEITARYPHEDLPDFQQPLAGKPLVVSIKVRDYQLDLINAGDEFTPGSAISLMVNFDPLFFNDDVTADQEAVERVWSQLMDGGTVRMPLDSYPFSARYGWVEDRFGINWQLMLTDPAGEPRLFMIPSLLFSGDVQGKAKEAGEFYREVFNPSAAGNVVRYPVQTGPAAAGEVMFSDFNLLNQWFTAMDSGAEGSESFSPGCSFLVQSANQAEIDHYW